MRERVVVGMSGGVDSCVAAALLQEQGYEVVGVTMRLWTTDRPSELPGRLRCCSVEDVDDAREIAGLLGIPHYVQNFERRFQEHVVDYFVDAYAGGRTPNPCLACNQHVKFHDLLGLADALDAPWLATGHYARRREELGEVALLRAADTDKDQSYFLYTLKQQQLTRVLFPLGDLSKGEVREIARRRGLPVAEKPDSEEICFVPGNDYRAFVRGRAAADAGEIVDSEGRVVGAHQGIIDYTVGQRRGLGAFGERRYVIALEPARRRVVIGSADDLLCRELLVSDLHFVSGTTPPEATQIEVKIRSRAHPTPATLHRAADGNLVVRLSEPQRAVTPGQAAVFYCGERVLGGAIIEHAWR